MKQAYLMMLYKGNKLFFRYTEKRHSVIIGKISISGNK